MPRPDDSYLKCEAFRERLSQADRLAQGLDLPKWPTRIAWVTICEGPLVARRFAQRRCNYRESPAWRAYTALLAAGIIDEARDGYIYTDAPEWDGETGIWRWVVAFIRVAAGEVVPDSFFGR